MKKRSVFIWALVLATTLSASPVFADATYEDADSDYLKVTAFFVRPVGQFLEWVIFRPIHALDHLMVPPDELEGRPARRCTSLRPSRDCARR